jgi:hypothetical protein
MTGRKSLTKLFIAAALAVAGALATTGSAFAGTADYTNTSSFSVPNNTGQAGIPQPVTVPAGQTAVQSVELTNVMPSYGGGGGADLSLRLTGPNGTSVDVLGSGCNVYPNTSAFTISDSAALAISDPAFCTTLKADPAPFKIKKKFAISARCDANCTVTTGGAAGATTTQLLANSVGTIVAPANKKAQKKGKGVVTLTATDETGGTATASVNAKTLKVKAKK